MSSIEQDPNQPVASAPKSATKPFYWSVRKELWENRSLYIAPVMVAAVVLLGMIASSRHLPKLRQNALLLDPVHRRAAIEMPYDIAAMVILVTAFIVAVFYCLDALHSERRDRSILFWKSLPVSDLTTVLSKATIPLVVLPAVVFGIIVITQFIMMLISSVVLMPSGLSGTTWANYNLFQQSIILLYSLVVLPLWQAPIYGWLLLVSGWARRATFLWAVLPLIMIQIFEKITFGTSYFTSLLRHRLTGFAAEAFDFHGRSHPVVDSLSQLTATRYLTSSGLWLGLVVAAVFIFAAVRLRRYQGPI
jgi:ABC-2 type transport system permease protein